MRKEKVISLISGRIQTEYEKYSDKGMDWAQISAKKIYSSLFMDKEGGKEFYSKDEVSSLLFKAIIENKEFPTYTDLTNHIKQFKEKNM
jgi:hypothetical protein